MARPPEIAAALREIKKKLAEVLPKLTEIETIVRPCDV
jgi:hypothetical protein